MFDPSIQTFCCYKPGVSSPSLDILSEFNAQSYNIVCLVSSIIGCLGASYQLLPRRDNTSSRRWYSITSVRGKQIIVWLAFADFNASLGVLVRSIFKLNNSMMFHWGQSFQVSICVLVAAWIEYFYMVTWFWTLFYAVDTRLALRQKSGMPKLYHGVAWVLSAALTFFGLAFLYYPDADCHNYSLMAINAGQVFFRLLPNYIMTYLVIASVMIASPILYFVSAKRIDEMVSNCLGQVTKKERSVAQAVRLRFGLINLLFYACWLPNLINGIILWTNWSDLPRNVLLPIWYIMAVMNPLQAFFNSIVYRRSNEKIVFPFCRQRTAEETPLLASNINT